MLTTTFFLVGIFLIILQTSPLQIMPGETGRPDLVYLLVAFAGYKFAWLPGIFLSFTLGWTLDVMVGANLGVYPLECLLVFISLKLITSKSPVRESAYQVPLVGVSYFILKILVYLLSTMTLLDTLPEWSWSKIIQETVLVLLAAIPCFLLFNSLYEFLSKRAKQTKSVRRRPRRHL